MDDFQVIKWGYLEEDGHMKFHANQIIPKAEHKWGGGLENPKIVSPTGSRVQFGIVAIDVRSEARVMAINLPQAKFAFGPGKS